MKVYTLFALLQVQNCVWAELWQDTARLTDRVKVASGAFRSPSTAGWTIVDHESTSLRADFKVNLRQCNIDQLEATALAVSDPDSSRYGRHLSMHEVCELTSCPDRENTVREILKWLLGVGEEDNWDGKDGFVATAKAGVQARVYCSHVAVSMDASVAADTFPEALLKPHYRRRGPSYSGDGDGGGGGDGYGVSKAVLRATGGVYIPKSVAGGIEFVSGLTELWPGAGSRGVGSGSDRLGRSQEGADSPLPLIVRRGGGEGIARWAANRNGESWRRLVLA